jgi:hypothetical protein
VQVFNDVAQHIEESALSPLIKMIYYLMVQFETEYDDQNLLQMFGEEQALLIQQLKMMPAEQRFHAMYLDAEFRVTGVSLAITREQRINRLVNWKQMISSDPGMMMSRSIAEEFRMWLKLFDMPQTLVMPFEQQLLQAEQQAMLAQMMGPAAPGGQQGPPGQNANNKQQAVAAQSRQAGQKETAPEPAQAQRPQ